MKIFFLYADPWADLDRKHCEPDDRQWILQILDYLHQQFHRQTEQTKIRRHPY